MRCMTVQSGDQHLSAIEQHSFLWFSSKLASRAVLRGNIRESQHHLPVASGTSDNQTPRFQITNGRR